MLPLVFGNKHRCSRSEILYMRSRGLGARVGNSGQRFMGGAVNTKEVWFKIKFLSSLVEYMVPSDKDSFLGISKGAQEGNLTELQEQELDRLFRAFDARVT
jgi:hypothetical protein